MRPLVLLVAASVAAVALIVVIGAISTGLRSMGLIAALPVPTATATKAPTPVPTEPPTPLPVVQPTEPPATAEPPTPEPKPEPPTPEPKPEAPTPIVERMQVTGAGPEGLTLRAEPSTSAAPVRTLHDGDILETIGLSQEADGRAWRNVRAVSDGATGWVAAEFMGAVADTPAAASAPPPEPTPAENDGALSPEATAYLNWAMPKIAVVSQAMRGLAIQSQQASRNSALLGDAEWRLRTAVALGFLKNSGEELQEYPGEITAEIALLDSLMRGLGEDLVYVADEYAEGLDQGSAARITSAAERMNAATEKMEKATTEVERLNREG